jgi:RNA polymerase sigma-70 factor (ECF subfamily)
MPIDLPVLVDRCRAGDELAWEAFVRQFQGRLFAVACSYVATREEARDVAQDIFVRLYEKRSLWPPAEDFLPWMFRTARNLCIDHLRRAKVRPTGVDLSADLLENLATEDRDPEARTAAASARETVWRGLKRLTAISREILVLRDIQGLSLEEVAGVLKIPTGTIKSRTNRARLELARVLTELGVTGPGSGRL